MSVAAAESATDKLQRTLYTAVGIGAVVFGGLLMPGNGGFMVQRTMLEPWFWTFAMAVALVLPASLTVLANRVPLAVTRTIARVCVVGFVSAQLLWTTAMTVDQMPAVSPPWLQGVTAIPCTLAGITWRTRWVWVVPALQGPLVTGVQLLAAETTVLGAAMDGVGALLFCSILVGIGQAIISAGEAQDAAAARAREAAMAAAASATVDRERARINAIVHDDIMSVLLAAERDQATQDLPAKATEAVDAIHALEAPDSGARAYSTADAAAMLRAMVADARPDTVATVSVGESGEIPGRVASAVGEAVEEALRNTARHAGDAARVEVTASITARRVVVTVSDDGAGFDPRLVGPTRLGIAASIAGRMASVPGGASRVDSAPGVGTKVTVSWDAP
ncbi:sensor histidine kinase [Demequina sp.]|uniref:sensor histidine kinase n=1 Tax=Demequina sp. TaxID=2050685 RepID=UPI003A8B0130